MKVRKDRKFRDSMIKSFKSIHVLIEKYLKCSEAPQTDESLLEMGVNLDAELTFRQ